MDPLSASPEPRAAAFTILAQRMFDGAAIRGPSAVEIRQGRIAAVRPAGGAPESAGMVRLPEGAVLAPGFIDTQVNGGGGVQLNDAPSVEAIRTIAQAHRRFGTTGLLPTLITDAPDRMEALLACAEEALAMPGVLGFHLEGPFLNVARKGIHPEMYIRQPSERDMQAISAFGALGRSLVTLAPECVGGDRLQRLRKAGLRTAVGHSDASAGEVLAAVENGATGVTHLFNAMSQMTARQPGVAGAALASDALTAGIICDGFHVDAVTLKAAFRAKGHDRLMLVTDAMALTGSDRDAFDLQGRTIRRRDGRLTDEAGTLAGADLTMFDAVRNAVRLMDIGLEDALVMASATPAAFLGLDDERGHIRPGFRADLVAFDTTRVLATWIAGEAG